MTKVQPYGIINLTIKEKQVQKGEVIKMYAIKSKATNETLALCKTVDDVQALIVLFNEPTIIRWEAK